MSSYLSIFSAAIYLLGISSVANAAPVYNHGVSGAVNATNATNTINTTVAAPLVARQLNTTTLISNGTLLEARSVNHTQSGNVSNVTLAAELGRRHVNRSASYNTTATAGIAKREIPQINLTLNQTFDKHHRQPRHVNGTLNGTVAADVHLQTRSVNTTNHTLAEHFVARHANGSLNYTFAENHLEARHANTTANGTLNTTAAAGVHLQVRTSNLTARYLERNARKVARAVNATNITIANGTLA